jgi:uncharacterized protein with PIN domain
MLELPICTGVGIASSSFPEASMTAKRCPICTHGLLGFIAHPTLSDDATVRVMATCTDCRHVFFYHFFFDEMLTELYAIDEDAHVRKPATRPNHLRLVKAPPVQPPCE